MLLAATVQDALFQGCPSHQASAALEASSTSRGTRGCSITPAPPIRTTCNSASPWNIKRLPAHSCLSSCKRRASRPQCCSMLLLAFQWFGRLATSNVNMPRTRPSLARGAECPPRFQPLVGGDAVGNATYTTRPKAIKFHPPATQNKSQLKL